MSLETAVAYAETAADIRAQPVKMVERTAKIVGKGRIVEFQPQKIRGQKVKPIRSVK